MYLKLVVLKAPPANPIRTAPMAELSWVQLSLLPRPLSSLHSGGEPVNKIKRNKHYLMTV